MTARPPKVPIAWATKSEFFVEYHHASGVPVVVRYPKTLMGLARVFDILVDCLDPKPPAKPTTHPATQRLGMAKQSPFTDATREAAREVLRRKGIIS